MEVLKDKDCTINTPVVLGVQDSPIYGKGISIKPRVDGRKDSKHFESIYLPELLPLEEYDLIVVLISGGKDSIACFYKLLELGVPKEKIELWHHDIDGGHPSRRMKKDLDSPWIIKRNTGDAALVGAATLNKAIQKAGGDNKNIFKLVIMHSEVATNLENMLFISHLSSYVWTSAREMERPNFFGSVTRTSP